MFCIAAFIVFGLLGIFSAFYRTLAKKAWGCVFRRLTLKPCDVSVQEEIKSRLIGKFILQKPRLAKFIDHSAGIFAWIFVLLSVWSLVVVLNSGLNLFVYDTCNPSNPESCSLAGSGCGIVYEKPGFWFSLKTGRIFSWAKSEVTTLGETISRIPNRLKEWEPADFLSSRPTYYRPYNADKKIALEIIDPGCRFCAQLFNDIKKTNFADRYNLTYLVYVIPNASQPEESLFPNSKLVARYLEAIKRFPLKNTTVPADWQILEKIFNGQDVDKVSYQNKFNTVFTENEAENQILRWLQEIGYSPSERQDIQKIAHSSGVEDSLTRQKEIVEKDIQTLKIPTIMFNGRRYDRALEPEKLK